MNTKLKTIVLGAVAALLLTTAARAQVTLTDIGTTAPTPGTYDIAQLSTNDSGSQPPGLNYYWDDGKGNPQTGYPSQTFTTLGNSAGYTLTSLAIKTDGNGGATAPASQFQTQTFTLSIYQLSGTGLTNAVLLNTFTATSALITEGDWMQWGGLGVNLAADSAYGYSFGINASDAENWERISTATNLPYTGGQACLIPNAGGQITYSTTPNDYDATFDLGLALPSAPIPAPPNETPSTANLAILPGSTNVTLTATSAGLTPITWQWQTDGGSGNTPTNILGATSSNLIVNTTGWSNGTYVFDFVASNALGTAMSSMVDILITNEFMEDIGTNAPVPGSNDVYQLVSTPYGGGTYAPGGFNYYTDDGAGHGAWAGQTFTTGTNTSGYVMNSLAWLSGGNGNSFDVFQLWDLNIYTLSDGGTQSTNLANYVMYGGGVEKDWVEYVGLNVPLAPNTQYAFTLGRDPSATGWEIIETTDGNVYPGGQIITIPTTTGGTVSYGTPGTLDATFDIGMSLSVKPYANEPTYTPEVSPVYAGTDITLSDVGVGTPPLSFQWYADNGTGGATWTIVGGATGTNLAVSTTALSPGNYEYEVVVTNASGASTSAPVTLNVVAASEPVIVADITPTPGNEGYVGETVSYSASFAGTLPITYQWMVNTGTGATPISGASNPSALTPTLILSNIQSGSAGTYSLVTSNAIGGPVSSSSSILTVLPDLPAPGAGTYGASVLADSPIGYWQFNETEDPSTGILPAYDSSGHNFDGLYGVSAENGFNSIQGPQPPGFPGFAANNAALQTQNGGADTYVTVPSLNINTNTVSITMWLNPSAPQTVYNGLFVYRNDINTDAAGLAFNGVVNSNNMAQLSYYWNLGSAATYNWNSGLFLPQNQWSFVALVIAPSNATMYLYYIDPNTSKPDLFSAVNAVTNGSEPFSNGTNLIGSDPYSPTSRSFNGDIDEVAIFNQSLTSAQVLALFSKSAGVGPLAPQITVQPQSDETLPNKTVTFSATGINGTSPFTYQWTYNTTNLTDGGNISGSATTTLTISNVTVADAGSYQLIVSNSVGATLSSVATLGVVTPQAGSYFYSALQYDPLAFWPLNETSVDPASGTALAFDYGSGFTGAYQTGSQDGFDGILGPESPAFPGFPANNTALQTTANIANSYVTASAGTLKATNLTYTAWINPSGPVENWAGILMDRSGAGEGLGFGGTVDDTGMSEIGYTWNQNNQNTWGFNTLLFPTAGQWSFVAMVIEPSQATIYLIGTNGVVQSTNNAIPQDSEEFGVAWHIGDDAAGGTTGGRTFPGSISSVGVYLSALSSNQIVTLADIGLGITPPPPTVTVDIAPSSSTPGSLVLSWSQGTLLESTNLLGPWVTNSAATSPFTVAPTNSQSYFKIKVD